MLELFILIIIWPATIGVMLTIDWLTGGVIAEAFDKDWPYQPRSFKLKENT